MQKQLGNPPPNTLSVFQSPAAMARSPSRALFERPSRVRVCLASAAWRVIGYELYPAPTHILRHDRLGPQGAPRNPTTHTRRRTNKRNPFAHQSSTPGLFPLNHPGIRPLDENPYSQRIMASKLPTPSPTPALEFMQGGLPKFTFFLLFFVLFERREGRVGWVGMIGCPGESD